MGEVIALRRDFREICRTARRLALQSLTRRERAHIAAVEGDQRLFVLYDALRRDYQSTGWFVVPVGYSKFETDALKTMHRFVDELASTSARLHELPGADPRREDDPIHLMPAR